MEHGNAIWLGKNAPARRGFRECAGHMCTAAAHGVEGERQDVALRKILRAPEQDAKGHAPRFQSFAPFSQYGRSLTRLRMVTPNIACPGLSIIPRRRLLL
jgi:hypothetical protein